jgi:(E)-4-hydroxy-3-methylbut-2-enyl-diphosphate synthase
MPVVSERHETRKVFAGSLAIGGDSPVSVQSMTNVPTTDAEAVLRQIELLSRNGAELVRVAVPDRESAESLFRIVDESPVPIVSDIHFNPQLALLALDAGTHKLRLNPGNIRKKKDIFSIAEKASGLGVPIRIGVNSGSLPGDIRERYGGINSDSMWAAAERHIILLREVGFEDIVLSLKSSSAMLTVEANRRAASECDYPIHLGVTEAGPELSGSVRSAVALSILLSEGIGDTLRISLSGSPEREPVVGWEILSSLEIRSRFPRIVSCPTCARARIDVASVAEFVQRSLEGVEGNVTIAVMGCEVNGPGEAGEADIALIGTPSGVQLFIDGKNREKVPMDDIPHYLTGIVEKYIRINTKNAGISLKGGKCGSSDHRED